MIGIRLFVAFVDNQMEEVGELLMRRLSGMQ